LNFKGTPSQEEHKTIFSGLKINVTALSDKIDFLAFLRFRKMTQEFPSIPEYGNLLQPLPRWLSAAKCSKIDFLDLTDSGNSL
jgi:hypothetical protein